MMRREVIGECELYLGDCREVLPGLGRVDAVVTDPPYHGVKKDGWDNQWRTDADFLQWAGNIASMVKNCLARNGSLYWFASPQMAGRLEVEIGRQFRVLNNIVWDKSESRQGVGGTGIDVGALRCYWSANTERLIFAEQFASDEGAAEDAGYISACVGVKSRIFGDYLRAEFKRAGVTNKQVAALFPSKTGGLTGCVSNWLLGMNVPTASQYAAMRAFLNKRGDEYLRTEYEYLRTEYEYLRTEYEELRTEYEELRTEYEELRRPFALSSSGEWGDVWRFKLERVERVHPAQKPLSMMEHIVRASSKQGQSVADIFMGSGTTGVACANLGRAFIGIEQDPTHYETALRRIEAAYRQPRLFAEPAVTAVQEPLI